MATIEQRVQRFVAAHTDRFGLLLALLVLAYLITGIDASASIRLAAGFVSFCAFLAGFVSTGMPGGYRFFAVLAIMGVVGALLVAMLPVDGLGMAIGALAMMVVIGALTVAVLRAVVSQQSVTGQTIMGAIAGYLLIGHVFAWAYLALPGLTGEAALDPASSGEVPLYFSYVVLTTLGFGDITPVGAFPQRIVTLEALIGQVFMAVLVARLVAVYSRPPKRDRSRGEVAR